MDWPRGWPVVLQAGQKRRFGSNLAARAEICHPECLHGPIAHAEAVTDRFGNMAQSPKCCCLAVPEAA
eukprot:8933806-Pyramimonas_sp.AAC.1